jgi:nucleotide-binding universal stress UspA family protein
MINILVPTDFSSLSKIAVRYAVNIANKLNGRITLLHVVAITKPVRVSMHDKMKDLEEDLISFAERDLNKLIREVCVNVTTTEPVKYSVVRSSDFNNAVKKEAKRLRTGLIVMGTNGASGLKKAVIGSNTASVIEFSQIPVLAVPKRAKFMGFRDIVYASDLRNLEKELKTLIPYAKQFDSTIHVLHIASSGNDMEALEQKVDETVQKFNYKNIVTLVLVDRFIEGAIDQYIGVSRADLLAMFTHDLTFYEKLFDRSHTRKMAFHSSVPLLAFKQSKERHP